MLGAVTEAGESFFARFPEYVAGDNAKHFILALYKELEDDLIVGLHGASYFRASIVTNLAARDGLDFVRLPAYRPNLNPGEECWRQLESALGNRYIESVDELTRRIDTALEQLSLCEYLEAGTSALMSNLLRSGSGKGKSANLYLPHHEQSGVAREKGHQSSLRILRSTW